MRHKTIYSLQFLSIALGVTILGCSKKNEVANPIVPTGTVELHLHNYIDISEIYEYGAVNTTEEGRKISLTMGQFFMSDMELKKADGTVFKINDRILLKEQQENVYYVGEVPAGTYTTFSFYVGVNSDINKKEPTVLDTALYHKEMWYGNTAQPQGFIFLHAEGKIDTTAEGDGPDSSMKPFRFRIGTNSNYTLVNINLGTKGFKIIPKESQYIHMYADYNKLFKGISLKGSLEVTSPEDNASPLATKLKSNIPSMFSLE